METSKSVDTAFCEVESIVWSAMRRVPSYTDRLEVIPAQCRLSSQNHEDHHWANLGAERQRMRTAPSPASSNVGTLRSRSPLKKNVNSKDPRLVVLSHRDTDKGNACPCLWKRRLSLVVVGLTLGGTSLCGPRGSRIGRCFGTCSQGLYSEDRRAEFLR